MRKLAKTGKGRVTHAVEKVLEDEWYNSHGWFHKAICGELVGQTIGEGEPTCKDCLAAIDRSNDRYRPIRKAMEELEFLLGCLPEDEELPDELRWKLHVLAASKHDYTFWVKKVGENPWGQPIWQATEVETGISGSKAQAPSTATENYWKEHS